MFAESIDGAARQCCRAAEQARRIAGMADRAAVAIDNDFAALSLVGRHVDAMITREAAVSVLLRDASAQLSKALSYRVIGSNVAARSLLHLVSGIRQLDAHVQAVAAAADVLSAAGLTSTLGQLIAADATSMAVLVARVRQVFVAESTAVPTALAV